ncbi:MAG TPA: hypothetical protein VGJ70_12925 [Solirubrobacteraceae bacterium]
MRFLFTTLQFHESDFYGRVSERLVARGHEAVHVTFSRRAARALRRRGLVAHCLPDAMRELGRVDVGSEVARIEATYATPSVRDIYKTDWPCHGRDEAWCVERTVRHVLALERIFDAEAPDVLVPEVGSETMRTATHLIGLERGIPVLFLFYTLFPDPLRLYRNTMHAPIVTDEDIRPLEAHEREQIEAFIAEFTTRRAPIRDHRRPRVNAQTLRDFARHIAVSASERDNEYLRPSRFVTGYARERTRAVAARALYAPVRADRPFAYFPLHVTDDYKIKRVIPHCVDQASIIEQVADALPQGYDLVLKEHPMSVGRNSLAMLRRLARIPNVRLVDPYTSSHDLMLQAQAVVVISSTVGLEALMYDKPVLTLGRPFYAGAGVTMDLDSFAGIREAVPAVLRWRPDHERILRFLHAAMRRCHPGAPVLVDRSDANAERLAGSLDAAVRDDAREPVAA